MATRGRAEKLRFIGEGLVQTFLGDMVTYWSIPSGTMRDGFVAAFYTPNRGLVVRKSTFGGSNVPDHMRQIDGSTRENVMKRLDEDRFFLYYEHERSLRTTDYEDQPE